jgi:hydrogenase nickel incorporation protein HypB
MINKAAKKLELKNNSVLFIENVGNLVCPSLFDLGESSRVVIISTTEGEDKPIKYPTMFENAGLCIINKTDLLPYVDFDIEKCKQYALQVNRNLEFIELSAKTEEGMDKWLDWIGKL